MGLVEHKVKKDIFFLLYLGQKVVGKCPTSPTYSDATEFICSFMNSAMFSDFHQGDTIPVSLY